MKKLIRSIAAPLAILALVGALPLAAQYSAKVYREQGGAKEVVSSGGEIEVRSGGTLDIQSGATLTVAAGLLSGQDNITVRASTNLGANDLVYLSSYNATDVAFVAALADADVVGGDAVYVTTAAIASGATGTVYRTATSTFTTTGSSVGDPVYLTVTGTTTNTMSLSAPSGADDRTQIIGRVTIVGNSSAGRVAVNLNDATPTIITGTQIRDASIADGDMVANTLTAASIATSAVETTEILDATITTTDISATANIARSQLVTETTQVYGIAPTSIVSNAGAALTAAETAGTFDVTIASEVYHVNGEVTDNETEVSVGYATFILPPEYVAASSVTIRMPAALIATGAAVDNASSLDIEVFEQSDALTVGSDICATAAATFAALDTWYNKDFTITGTGLVAGDRLVIKITASVVDSEAGGGTIVLNLMPPKVLLSIKG